MDKNMLKVGIAGVPSQNILDCYINKSEMVDLDMPIDCVDYFDIIEKFAPKIYCATLKTVFVNALTLHPDVIIADVGEGKCDGMRFIA
jgi:hypothetical protein